MMPTNPSGHELHCVLPQSCKYPNCMCVTEEAWKAKAPHQHVQFDASYVSTHGSLQHVIAGEAAGQLIESIQLVRRADVVEEISFELSNGRILVVTGAALFGENVELSMEWR